MTLLSETNYAECQSSSLSNRLCCCGSLEGRSFILLSTPISPRGFCSSVAERVPLLRSFHLPQFELWLCVWLWGCGRKESVCPCEEITERADCSAWFMRACACLSCACLYTCRYRCMCCFTQCLCSTCCRLVAYRSPNTDHHTPPTLSTACIGNREGVIEL